MQQTGILAAIACLCFAHAALAGTVSAAQDCLTAQGQCRSLPLPPSKPPTGGMVVAMPVRGSHVPEALVIRLPSNRGGFSHRPGPCPKVPSTLRVGRDGKASAVSLRSVLPRHRKCSLEPPNGTGAMPELAPATRPLNGMEKCKPCPVSNCPPCIVAEHASVGGWQGFSHSRSPFETEPSTLRVWRDGGTPESSALGQSQLRIDDCAAGLVGRSQPVVVDGVDDVLDALELWP